MDVQSNLIVANLLPGWRSILKENLLKKKSLIGMKCDTKKLCILGLLAVFSFGLDQFSSDWRFTSHAIGQEEAREANLVRRLSAPALHSVRGFSSAISALWYPFANKMMVITGRP